MTNYSELIRSKITNKRLSDEIIRDISNLIEYAFKGFDADDDIDIFYEKVMDSLPDFDLALRWLALDENYFDYVIHAFEDYDYYGAIIFDDKKSSQAENHNAVSKMWQRDHKNAMITNAYEEQYYTEVRVPKRGMRDASFLRDVIRLGYAQWASEIIRELEKDIFGEGESVFNKE